LLGSSLVYTLLLYRATGIFVEEIAKEKLPNSTLFKWITSMITRQTPLTLDDIDHQFDEMEECLTEISHLYQNHPNQYKFGQVLVFNSLWRWRDGFITTHHDRFLPSFQSITGINDMLSKRDLRGGYYYYRGEMYTRSQSLQRAKISALESKDPWAEIRVSTKENLVKYGNEPLDEGWQSDNEDELTNAGVITATEDPLLYEDKLKTLFQRDETLQQAAEQIKLSQHLSLRAKKFSCLFILFKLRLFNPDYLNLLWQLPVEHAEQMLESLKSFNLKQLDERTPCEVKYLFTHLDNLKNITSILQYLHQHDLDSMEYLNAAAHCPDDQLQLLQSIVFFQDHSSFSMKSGRPQIYDENKIAKALLDGMLKITEQKNTNTEEKNVDLSTYVNQPIQYSITVGDLKQALDYHDELEKLYSQDSYRLEEKKNYDHLRVTDGLANEALLPLTEKQLGDFAYMVKNTVNPKSSTDRKLNEKIFQLKVKVQDSELAIRLFGKERARYLKQNTLHCPMGGFTPFDCLLAFLFEPHRYDLLPYVNDVFQHIPSLDWIRRQPHYPNRWSLTIDELKLLKPYIDAGDLAKITAMTCGLRWLTEFGLLNEERIKHVLAAPLGLQLLSQVGFYRESKYSSEKQEPIPPFGLAQKLAVFVYESLLPLIQSEKVETFFKALTYDPKIDIILSSCSTTYVVEPNTEPKPVEDYRLSNNDIFETHDIIKDGELRDKEIHILDGETRELKHILPVSRLHKTTKNVEMLSPYCLVTYSAYYKTEPVSYSFAIDMGIPDRFPCQLKIWDLKKNVCVKTVLSDELFDKDEVDYKLLSGNRLAYYEKDKMVIYQLDKNVIETQWHLPALSYNFSLTIDKETEDGLTVSIDGKEKLLRSAASLFELSRHWLFAENRASPVIPANQSGVYEEKMEDNPPLALR